MKRFIILLALVLIGNSAFIVSAIAADNSAVAIRSLVDRPDDLIGYQIRLIYVVPADAKDRNLDTNGTIGKWIEEARKISRVQTGLTPRFDTYLNKYDVGFLKSKFNSMSLFRTPVQKLAQAGLLALNDPRFRSKNDLGPLAK